MLKKEVPEGTGADYETFGKGNYIIRICSFNVNCKFSKTQKFEKWLRSEQNADIIAIGLQELYFKLKDVIYPESIFSRNVHIEAHQRWINLFASLGFLKENYKLIVTKSYAALCIFIFIKNSRIKNLFSPVTNIMMGCIPLGMLGMANKGGLSIAFRFDDISLCFINCHLPAGIENPSKRQHAMQTIIRKLQLNHFKKSKKVNLREAEFDLMFLFGDLNFRLQNTTSQDVTDQIKSDQMLAVERLLKMDEMISARDGDVLYQNFNEGKIEFLPTYKFLIDTNDYNLKRVPSYCDRILWLGRECINITYSCHPEVTISDHQPISADFFVDTNAVSKKLSGASYQTRQSHMIKIYNTTIDFGDVYFHTNHVSETKIENKGSLKCEVSIKNLRSHQNTSTWFTIIPNSFTLEPKQVCSVQFRVFIDCDNVGNFNINKEDINCTIVSVSVTKGPKTALRFQGNYHLSLFGIQLEHLQFIERPISNYKSSDIEKFERLKVTSVNNLLTPFDLLKRIMDLLMPPVKNCKIFSEIIFQQQSDLKELSILISTINELDVTAERSLDLEQKYQIGTYIEALLLYIKCLPQPLIPFVIQARLAANSGSRHHVLKVLHNLPRTHIVLLRQIAQFLHRFINNKEDVEFIANFVVTCIPPSSPALLDSLVEVLSFLIQKPQML